MESSRRVFTNEFKLAAVRRLEQAVSIAVVARALEVNPNVLHRWRRESRQGPSNAFPGNGKQRWAEGHFRYYGVPMNAPALHIFRFQVGWLWQCALSRRSQNGCVTWDRMRRLIDRWLPPARSYHDYRLRRLGVIT